MTVLMLCVFGVALFGAGCNGGSGDAAIASLMQHKGKVEVRSHASAPYSMATSNHQLAAGGAVRTGDDGQAQVRYLDGTEVSLHPDTIYEIKNQASLGRQESGSAQYRVTPQSRTVRVETPHGVTAVLGTSFRLEVTPRHTVITLQEGKVRFTASSGASADLKPGQQVIATSDAPPTEPIELDLGTLESMFNPGLKTPPVNHR